MQTESIAIALASAIIGFLLGHRLRVSREKSQNTDLRVELARKTDETMSLARQLVEMKKSHDATLSRAP
jgi:glucose-6-phosphate-specific signal transduction histidine kinase